MTTGHIQSLHFADHATAGASARVCRRVLARLHERRVIEHLERRVGGVRAGSSSFVWRVGAIGDRLLRTEDDAPRDRRSEPSLRFLDHSLAISDCIVQLTVAARHGAFEVVRVEPEPASWRRYLGPGGVRETLKPDISVVTAADDYEDHFYVEVDRGTEHIPTVIKQCVQYETYRRTGKAQAELGVFPIVLWLAPDQARVDKIQAAIHRTRTLDRDLFRVGLLDRFAEIVTAGGAA